MTSHERTSIHIQSKLIEYKLIGSPLIHSILQFLISSSSKLDTEENFPNHLSDTNSDKFHRERERDMFPQQRQIS